MARGKRSKAAAAPKEKEVEEPPPKTVKGKKATKADAAAAPAPAPPKDDAKDSKEVAPAAEAPAPAPAAAAEEEEETRTPVWEPDEADVLSGRGANVNAHSGNKKFRALCFARKPEFEAGSHAAKRRVATEIVDTTLDVGDGKTARFLKKKVEKGPWFEMTKEQAILKACQVMRDYKRPDRLAIREMMAASGQARKRTRTTESTPMLDTPIPTGPLEPIIENPWGVHDHDILSGRGAFVNGHIGNQRLRSLALERKTNFDSGNYTEKRTLATEIVQIIKQLDPPGRFLKKVTPPEGAVAKEGELDPNWEELTDEKAIHKACQVMRDIDRPDRKDREIRREKKKQKQMEKKQQLQAILNPTKKDGMTVLAETTAEKAAVEEAVAATEEALDKALAAGKKTSAEV